MRTRVRFIYLQHVTPVLSDMFPVSTNTWTDLFLLFDRAISTKTNSLGRGWTAITSSIPWWVAHSVIHEIWGCRFLLLICRSEIFLGVVLLVLHVLICMGDNIIRPFVRRRLAHCGFVLVLSLTGMQQSCIHSVFKWLDSVSREEEILPRSIMFHTQVATHFLVYQFKHDNRPTIFAIPHTLSLVSFVLDIMDETKGSPQSLGRLSALTSRFFRSQYYLPRILPTSLINQA